MLNCKGNHFAIFEIFAHYYHFISFAIFITLFTFISDWKIMKMKLPTQNKTKRFSQQ